MRLATLLCLFSAGLHLNCSDETAPLSPQFNSQQTSQALRLVKVVSPKRSWQLSSVHGKTISTAGSMDEHIGVQVSTDAEGSFVLGQNTQTLVYSAREKIKVLDEPAARFYAHRVANCPIWSPWPSSPSVDQLRWSKRGEALLTTPVAILAKAGNYVVMAPTNMPDQAAMVSQYCIRGASDAPARFAGEHIWIGSVISGDGVTITGPLDVPYSYERVSKTSIGFDPSRAIRVIFARHGETISNRLGLWQGNEDQSVATQALYDALVAINQTPTFNVGDIIRFDLNDNGKQDAQILAESLSAAVYLPALPVTIVSSPLHRAKQTATYFADLYQKPVVVLDDLHEHSLPGWVGLHSKTQIHNIDPDHAKWVADPYTNNPPAAETATDLVRRVDSALSQVSGLVKPGETVVAFTHKGYILWFLERYLSSRLGVSEAELAAEPGQESAHWKVPVPNAAWAEIYLYDGRAILPDINGAPHYFPIKTPDPTPNTLEGGPAL